MREQANSTANISKPSSILFIAVSLFVLFAAISYANADSQTKLPTMADLWNKSAHFVPVPLAEPIPGIGHREAFAVLRPDIGEQTVYLYYRCRSPEPPPRLYVCLGISTDGGNRYLQSAGIIITPNPGHDFAVAPSVAKIRDRWVMVYEEGGIRTGTLWAESSDGIHWKKNGELFANEKEYRATPGLYVYQDTVYVFYALKNPINSNHLSISFSSGRDMNDLQPVNEFVLSGSQPWDNGSVSMPRIIFDGGTHWMFYEGATQNMECGGGSNVYGWGVAQSTDLKHWVKYPNNPIAQSEDAQSCGMDMPQPFRFPSGQIGVYHTSDDTTNVILTTLQWGSACLVLQTAPNWREKNYMCMRSCGNLGGNRCEQTRECRNGKKVGTSWDCTSCCK